MRLILLTAVLGMSLTGVAQAKLVSFGTLGSGRLCQPQGVAVDQASHGVEVGDLNFNPPSSCSGVSSFAPAGLFGFASSGNLISPPSPFGSGSGLYSSVAVNPVNGDLYVRDGGSGSIETYDPSTGGQIGSPCSVSGTGLEQIASDAAGNMYVPNTPGNDVEELDSACNPVQTITGSGATALSGPTGVAVDPAGDVWIADAGNNRIEEFGPTGAFIGSIPSAGVQTVAVDASGHVFALVENAADPCGADADVYTGQCAHVVEYSAAGAQLDDVGAGTIGPGFFEAQGATSGVVNSALAVDDTTGIVYVTDSGNNIVTLFGPSAPPAISRELAEQVTASGATLGARIDPSGLDTSYHFDYGTTTAYGQTAPVPDGDAGSGGRPTAVGATASGLAPSTTYHYQVVATNSLGTVTGPDQTFTTTAGGCPNEQFRTRFSTSLPDCRAYEMVTPPDKDSGGVGPLVLGPDRLYGYQVAPDGHAVTYFSQNTFPGSPTNGVSYLAVRGAGGWSSQNLIPPQSAQYALTCTPAMYAFSADLSRGILQDGNDSATNTCGSDDPPLVAGEPADNPNLFLRDNADGSYQLVDVTPAGVTPAPAAFDGGSADLSHVVFDEQAHLTPDAPVPPAGFSDLYEWTGGQVRLVSYVPPAGSAECGAGGPGCTPVAGLLAGDSPGQKPDNRPAQIEHAVSADGSRIFFTTQKGNLFANGNLYVRLNGTSTVQVDASKAGGSGGGGSFQIASADGSRALFTDDASAGLTSDTVPGSGANLYSYDTNTGQLTDLTPGATVDTGSVIGASDDASYVYFTAGGVLAPGATAGAQNIYLYHNGTTTFVASPSNLGAGPFVFDAVRVSANGRFLAFTSTDSLTGYDTAGTCTIVSDPSLVLDPVYGPGGHCNEIYLYDSTSGQLACASCNPDGDAPYGGAILAPPTEDLEPFRYTGNVEGTDAPLPPLEYAPNSVSDSGRVFFDTQDALLPGDTNGHSEDVYEYEAGHLHLLSPGTTQDNAWFVNATPSGSDVFVLTSQQLLPQDGDTSPDLYDARVGGGFPAPPPTAAPCVGDACRPGVGAAPPPPAASSVTFFGPGNASSSATPAGGASVLTRSVHGTSFLVKVGVPAAGRITISGAGIGTVRRSLARAGRYAVRVSLTQAARRALARAHRLSVRLRVGYAPPGSGAQTASVGLTVMSSLGHRSRHARRATTATRRAGK